MPDKYSNLESQLDEAHIFNEAPNVYTRQGFHDRLMEIIKNWHEEEMDKKDQKMAEAMVPSTPQAAPASDIKPGEQIDPVKVDTEPEKKPEKVKTEKK